MLMTVKLAGITRENDENKLSSESLGPSESFSSLRGSWTRMKYINSKSNPVHKRKLPSFID